MHVAWFIPIGFLICTYGTIIGAGGGFVIVPILVFLFPADGPSTITAASLAVIFVNAASGTIAYAVQRRVSYRTGTLFAAATIPGALVGSWLTHFIPRRVFGLLFGALLVLVAAFLSVSRGIRVRTLAPPAETSAAPLKPVFDTVVDSADNSYALSLNVALGVGLSLVIGCFSSLVGIGGGLIHVPVLMYLFGFPLHVATATSHFILIFTALAGLVEHVFDRTWPTYLTRDLCPGAQLGASLSRKISAPWIMLGLALALGG